MGIRIFTGDIVCLAIGSPCVTTTSGKLKNLVLRIKHCQMQSHHRVTAVGGLQGHLLLIGIFESDTVPFYGKLAGTDGMVVVHIVGLLLRHDNSSGEFMAGGGGHGHGVRARTHGNALRGISRAPKIGDLNVRGDSQRGGIALTDSCFALDMDVRRNDAGVRYKA